MEDKPHHMGHRQRLRAKFLASGKEALADYELLELVLFNSNSRKDVKPLAKNLIKEFGNLAGVIKANAKDLKKIFGKSIDIFGNKNASRSSFTFHS